MLDWIATPIPTWLMQLTAVFVVALPLVAFQADLGRVGGLGLFGFIRPRSEPRWRLEFYSAGGPVDGLLNAESEMPFPVKRVQSARGAAAAVVSSTATWMLPQFEMDVTALDPWADEVLQGIFVAHRVRFVSGDEAMVDAGAAGEEPRVPVRVRAVAHRG